MNTARQTKNGHLLTDLGLHLLHRELRPVYCIAAEERRNPVRNSVSRFTDFATVSGKHNLAQAITMRLLTPRGELAMLAHPDYGSRLHELIGRPNIDTTCNLVRLYIIEALQREPRIAEIKKLEVAPVPGTRDRLDVFLQVLPTFSSEIVAIEGINLVL